LQNPAERVSLSDFNALKNQLIERDARDLVASAMREGKITAEGTALHSWALDAAIKAPAVFASWLSSAPKMVSTEIKRPADGGGESVALTSDEQAVARQMGISDDLMLKQKTAELAARKQG